MNKGKTITVNARYSPYIVPNPDGINDKKIINDALIYAYENGLNVLFPANKTYVVSSDITKENIISIPGDNMTIDLNGSTIKLLPNGFTHYHLIDVYEKNNIVIKNGKIQGDRLEHDYDTISDTHEFGYGISCEKSTVTIENCEIFDMTGDSIFIFDYKDNVDGTFSKGNGIVRIIDSKLYKSRRQGITVLASNEVYIDNCDIYQIGESDGVKGASPMACIDLEPSSKTKNIEKFEIKNSRLDGALGTIIASNNCTVFNVSNCELNGRIMIADTLYNPIFSNCKFNIEYIDSNLMIGYSSPTTEFYNCKFKMNRFDLKGKYSNCEIVGLDDSTLSNLIKIYNTDTDLVNVKFKDIRSKNFNGLLFNSVQNEENRFEFTNVSIDNCDVALIPGDFGTNNNYNPYIKGVTFKNSYIGLVRDKQEFEECNFYNNTYKEIPTYFTQSLLKMNKCNYVDPKLSYILNLKR